MAMPELKKQMKWIYIWIAALTFFYFIDYASRLSEYDRLDETRNDVKRNRLMIEATLKEKLWEYMVIIDADYLISHKAFKVTRSKYVDPHIVAIMAKLPYLPKDED